MPWAVYKYRVEPDDYVDLHLPPGARPVHFGCQRGDWFLWVLVDPSLPPNRRRQFRMAGTGHPIAEPPGRLTHVGTATNANQTLVFHLFEIQQEEIPS
jgi:hypothetical protein